MARILVIDDNEHVREALRCLLRGGGYEVEEACDGRQGLEQATRRRPDLILCDLNMPVMDGFETLKRVRSDPTLEKVPVIVISGSACEADECRAKRCGANSFIGKPFSLRPLLERMREELGTCETRSTVPAPTVVSAGMPPAHYMSAR
jgi:CheY-like chemotaxis protein